MGGISGFHIIVLVIIAVVLFAPKRIGQAGQSFGEAVRGFKKGLNGEREEIDVTPRLDPSHQDTLTQKQREKDRQDS